MKVKEYLHQAYRLDKRIQSHIEEMECLKEMATSVSSPRWDEKVQTSRNSEGNFVRCLERIMDLELILDTNWKSFADIKEDARAELFSIILKLAKTPIKEREDEKRFIIPLHGLITTDGKQQYLTYKDGFFFASRRDENLVQTWKEEHLELIPEFYRQFAEEFDEGKEY